MRLLARSTLVLLLTTLLAGCGFHLRGSQGSGASLPYETLLLALPAGSEVRHWLERHIRASGKTTLLASPKEAQASVQELSENRQKSILSVDARGRVREYRLQLSYRFRVVSGQNEEIVAPITISLVRDLSYDDAGVLAKDQEEAFLWRDMRAELAAHIMRRLSIVQPGTPDQDEQ